MSWISTVSQELAAPEVQKSFDFLKENWGFVPNYFLALGGNGQRLTDQINLFTNVMFNDSGLPRVIKEQIALVVSGINTSSYCVAAHMEILASLGVEKPLGRKLAVDFENAPVENKVKELFRFAAKLTKQPGDMVKSDVSRLLELGWSEAAVLDAVLVVSLYACANRFSAGLGLLPDF